MANEDDLNASTQQRDHGPSRRNCNDNNDQRRGRDSEEGDVSVLEMLVKYNVKQQGENDDLHQQQQRQHHHHHHHHEKLCGNDDDNKDAAQAPSVEQTKVVSVSVGVPSAASNDTTTSTTGSASTARPNRALPSPSLVGAVSVSSSRGTTSLRAAGDDNDSIQGETTTNHHGSDVEAQMNLVEAELVEPQDDSKVVIAVAAPEDKKRKWIYIATGVLLILIVIILVVVTATTLSRAAKTTAASNEHPQVDTEEAPEDQSIPAGEDSSKPQDEDSASTTASASSIPQQLGNTIIGSAAYDRFGEAIGLSSDGSIVAVGARNNGNLGFESGLVRVFQSTPSSSGDSIVWAQMGNAIGGQNAGDRFGFSGLSLSSNGLRVAVGAPFHNVTTISSRDDAPKELVLPHAGNVRVFDFVTSPNPHWEQVGPSIDGLEADHWFGRSVVISEDGRYVAACAYQSSSENGENSGHVRVFRQVMTSELETRNQTNADGDTTSLTTSTWTQVGRTIHGLGTLDRLGRSLAISANGTRLAAGATQFKKEPESPGYVQVFDLDPETDDWTQVGQTIVGDHDQDVMGREVALSSDGSILACSANLNDQGGDEAGMVRVYQLVVVASDDDHHQWQQLGQTILGSAPGERLGDAISLSGDGTMLAVGGTEKKTAEGVTRLWEYYPETELWEQVGHDLTGAAVGDRFGADMQLSQDGSFLAISSPSSDANGEDSGITQVFDLGAP